MDITLTINRNKDQLKYLKRQIEITELKIKNLESIKSSGHLMSEGERKNFISNILIASRNNDLQTLKTFLA